MDRDGRGGVISFRQLSHCLNERSLCLAMLGCLDARLQAVRLAGTAPQQTADCSFDCISFQFSLFHGYNLFLLWSHFGSLLTASNVVTLPCMAY